MGEEEEEGKKKEKEVAATLFIANATELSISIYLSLSPRIRARALAAAHSASSTITLERRERLESRRRVAGRVVDTAGSALPVGNDDNGGDDVHRAGQRRSWPTNGSAAGERVTDAVLRLVYARPG